MKKNGGREIKSVENTFDILDYLQDSGGRTLEEITDHIGLAKSTTYDYLATLEQQDAVLNRDNRYYLGYALLRYGGSVKARSKLYQIAKPKLDSIAKETGLTAYLATKYEDKLFRITSVAWEDTVPVENRDGKQEGWHATALGKVILADIPHDESESILSNIEYRQLTENTITNSDDLREDLELIKDNGYAINDQEYFPGWKGIAVSISLDEVVLGGISVSGPKTKIEEEQADIIQMLDVARDEIEAEYSRE